MALRSKMVRTVSIVSNQSRFVKVFVFVSCVDPSYRGYAVSSMQTLGALLVAKHVVLRVGSTWIRSFETCMKRQGVNSFLLVVLDASAMVSSTARVREVCAHTYEWGRQSSNRLQSKQERVVALCAHSCVRSWRSHWILCGANPRRRSTAHSTTGGLDGMEIEYDSCSFFFSIY